MENTVEAQEAYADIKNVLNERIKELKCIYKFVELIDASQDICKILQGVVEILPLAMQYPEISCARIFYGQEIYHSENFKSTPWTHWADLKIFSEKKGRVEVCYLQNFSQVNKELFLGGEKILINSIGVKLSKIIENIINQKKLYEERKALQDANIALYDSLVQSQRERKNLGRYIRAKIEKTIMPVFSALEVELNPLQINYLNILKKNLSEIVSPISADGHSNYNKLSPAEILICNMIKQGLSTKEISTLRHISPATVNRQRESIRRKLGLTNCKVNLASYLGEIGKEEN